MKWDMISAFLNLKKIREGEIAMSTSRHLLPCTYYGGFNRNSSFVHPELSKMIGLRGLGDLTSIKEDFLDFLTHLSQTGLSPIVGV
jgi:hypothetical protein